MNIARVRLYRYALPLDRPLQLRGATLRERRGLIVRVEDAEGRWGAGDIAPLPGFSRESLEQVEGEALRAAAALEGAAVPPRLRDLSDRFERWLYWQHLSDALNCGLQAAVMDLSARAEGRSLAGWLADGAAAAVPVNGLLLGAGDDLLRFAEALLASGYRALKLKVGRVDVREEAAQVRRLRDLAGPEVELRLDANRAWEYPEARAFLGAVSDSRVAYIEEPLRDPTRLVRLAGETGVPVALDETLVEAGIEALERWRGVKVVVLKPTLLGGFEMCWWMARRALNAGMTPVVSASFESGVGLADLAHLAAGFRQPDVAAGLDTYRWFTQDVLAERIDMDAGVVDLAQATRAKESLQFDALEEVSR
jgi:O-succinylbenzoate synthase